LRSLHRPIIDSLVKLDIVVKDRVLAAVAALLAAG